MRPLFSRPVVPWAAAGALLRAGLRFDFTTGAYPEPITVTRASTKWVRDSDGIYQSFGADALARTDGEGAVIEPAGSGAMLHNNALNASSWARDSGTTVSSLGTTGPILGQTAYRFSVSGGNGRINQSDVAITSGQVRRVSAIAKAVDAFKFAFFRTDIAATLNNTRNYVFDLELGVARWQGGGQSNVSILPVGNGYYLITFDVTVGFTGAAHNFYFGVSNVELTSNSFTAPSAAGAYDVAFIDHTLAGTDESLTLSGVAAASRAADVVTLPLGASPGDLVFTFDDDTTQTVPAVSGDYVIDPATLSRPRIKSAVWS